MSDYYESLGIDYIYQDPSNVYTKLEISLRTSRRELIRLGKEYEKIQADRRSVGFFESIKTKNPKQKGNKGRWKKDEQGLLTRRAIHARDRARSKAAIDSRNRRIDNGYTLDEWAL